MTIKGLRRRIPDAAEAGEGSYFYSIDSIQLFRVENGAWHHYPTPGPWPYDGALRQHWIDSGVRPHSGQPDPIPYWPR